MKKNSSAKLMSLNEDVSKPRRKSRLLRSPEKKPKRPKETDKASELFGSIVPFFYLTINRVISLRYC